MARCIKLKRRKRQVCLGDLDTLITFQNRTITAPFSGVDATEIFTDTDDVFAKLDTGRGQTIFDGTNEEQIITHTFTIRFISGITAETWVLFESQRLDIADVEDLEERHEFLMLRCNNRGTTANSANEA